jgi:hypothetical protein
MPFGCAGRGNEKQMCAYSSPRCASNAIALVPTLCVGMQIGSPVWLVLNPKNLRTHKGNKCPSCSSWFNIKRYPSFLLGLGFGQPSNLFYSLLSDCPIYQGNLMRFQGLFCSRSHAVRGNADRFNLWNRSRDWDQNAPTFNVGARKLNTETQSHEEL